MKYEKPEFGIQKLVPANGDETPGVIGLGRRPEPGNTTLLSRRSLLGNAIRIPTILAMAGGGFIPRAEAEIEAQIPKAHSSGVLSLAISTDGKTLASGGGKHELKLWPIGRATHAPTRINTPFEELNAIAFSPNGQHLACGYAGGTIELRSAQSGTSLKSWPGHSNKDITTIAFSSNSDFLITGGKDDLVSIWHIPSGELEVSLGHDAQVRSVALSDDGRLLAAASERTVKLWSIPSTAPFTIQDLTSKGGHTALISDLAFLPGNLLASCSYDKSILVRSATDLKITGKLAGHTKEVNALRFIPHSGQLASASDDMTVRIWSIDDLSQSRQLLGHADIVGCLAVSPDGHTLFSGDGSGAIIVWNLAGGTLSGYLFDPASTPSSSKGITYTLREEVTGRTITFTLPCGSPIPQGAVCLCNCVPGAQGYYTAPPTYTRQPTYTSTPTYTPAPVQVGPTIRRPCTAQAVPPGYVCQCNCIPGQ
jgi:WD40 repeat protein